MTPAELNILLIAAGACPALIFLAMATNKNEGATPKRRKNYMLLASALGALALVAAVRLVGDML